MIKDDSPSLYLDVVAFSDKGLVNNLIVLDG